jgi:hypothetical protein
MGGEAREKKVTLGFMGIYVLDDGRRRRKSMCWEALVGWRVACPLFRDAQIWTFLSNS